MDVISAVVSLALTVWFIVFTILVLQKLSKIIVLLDKNK